jgi:hypothetical protein
MPCEGMALIAPKSTSSWIFASQDDVTLGKVTSGAAFFRKPFELTRTGKSVTAIPSNSEDELPFASPADAQKRVPASLLIAFRRIFHALF